MNYCIIAWGSQSERKYKIQKKVVRLLTTSRYNSHMDLLLKRKNLFKNHRFTKITRIQVLL